MMKLPKGFVFVDAGGDVVAEVRDIFKLPLDEGFIVSKSVEMFNDPEPCVIHKSAVIKRVILDACEGGDFGGLVKYLNMPDGAVAILTKI